MTDRELMQEALYALTYVGDAKEIYSDTIESLRARLAQPEEPDWSAAGFSKPPKQWDRQCPSCGGFCKKSGCERENVQPEQRSEQWWKHEVSNAWAEGYEKGRSQREWIGLTDEEIMEIVGVTSADSDWNVTIVHKWIHAIEAKLKEKNT